MTDKDRLELKIRLEARALNIREEIKRELAKMHEELARCAETAEPCPMTDSEFADVADTVSSTLALLARSAVSLSGSAAALREATAAIRMVNRS